MEANKSNLRFLFRFESGEQVGKSAAESIGCGLRWADRTTNFPAMTLFRRRIQNHPAVRNWIRRFVALDYRKWNWTGTELFLKSPPGGTWVLIWIWITKLLFFAGQLGHCARCLRADANFVRRVELLFDSCIIICDLVREKASICRLEGRH